jgi:hypothetical protein
MPVIEDNQGAFQYPATMTTTPIWRTISEPENAPPANLLHWITYAD